jgi:hypothetical protein
MWLCHWTLVGSWLVAVDLGLGHTLCCSNIERSTRNHENEGKSDIIGWMLYSVHVVLSVFWTCFVHHVISWSCYGEIGGDNSTWCSVIMVELLKRKGDGRYKWEQYERYEWIWEIMGTTGLIDFWRPAIDDISSRIGILICRLGDGKLTASPKSSSPSSSWRSPPSPLITLILIINSAITWVHDVKSSLCISPWHNHEITLSSIHWVQHHSMIGCLPLPASLISPLSGLYFTQFTTCPQLQVIQGIKSLFASGLIPALPTPNCSTPSTPPISIGHGL